MAELSVPDVSRRAGSGVSRGAGSGVSRGAGSGVSRGAGSGVSQSAPDLGRVVVVVLFAVSLLSALGRGWATARSGGADLRAAIELLCCLTTAAFCALVVAAYLRRGAALATDRTLRVRIVAPLATCLPLVVPLLPMRPAGSGRAVVALALVLAGTAWCVWAVRHLARCLSVVPQARHLVASGPYRWVRHPLYLGEVVALTGTALNGGRWTHAVVVLALLGLQLYRARREEALLAAAVPGYAAYAARTWRLVPGVASRRRHVTRCPATPLRPRRSEAGAPGDSRQDAREGRVAALTTLARR